MRSPNAKTKAKRTWWNTGLVWYLLLQIFRNRANFKHRRKKKLRIGIMYCYGCFLSNFYSGTPNSEPSTRVTLPTFPQNDPPPYYLILRELFDTFRNQRVPIFTAQSYTKDVCVFGCSIMQFYTRYAHAWVGGDSYFNFPIFGVSICNVYHIPTNV